MAKRDLLLKLLEETSESYSGFAVNDRDHGLQTATRSLRAGADEELVVAALFHDAAKSVSPECHGRLIATLLETHVRRDVADALRIHQDFTAAHLSNGRGAWRRWMHRWRPCYRLAAVFADEWDAPSRDPGYDSESLDTFLPIVDRVLNQQYPLRRPLRQRIKRKIARLLAPQ